jgi:cyclopropane fatty-acyl-phospholipid synthase-like methyltransferase
MSIYTTPPKEIAACRLCGGATLEPLLSLGNHYVNDFPHTLPPAVVKCPIDVVVCPSCSLVQLKHSAPQEILYSRHYWYKSGINEKIVNDLKEIAEIAMKHMPEGGAILDIGANDGTLLKFISRDYHRVGVEPADNLQEDLRENCDVAIHDFWRYDDASPRYDVITAIGMFYDLEEPLRFVEDVRKALRPDGIFIAQLMTAKKMVEQNDLGNLCHEHLEFYTYESLKYLFEHAGLEIYHIEENDINGGSYRIFARHYREGSIDYPEEDLDWGRFEENIMRNRDQCVSFINEAVSAGKKVYAYGASTKGNTILQYYGLGGDVILGVADRNPEKYGKYMLTGIPIVPEEEGRENADYFLVLPYGFKDVFVGREKDWLKKGGSFIIPLPNFHIIDAKNL